MIKTDQSIPTIRCTECGDEMETTYMPVHWRTSLGVATFTVKPCCQSNEQVEAQEQAEQDMEDREESLNYVADKLEDARNIINTWREYHKDPAMKHTPMSDMWIDINDLDELLKYADTEARSHD